mgnify:CR=1 FL=1
MGYQNTSPCHYWLKGRTQSIFIMYIYLHHAGNLKITNPDRPIQISTPKEETFESDLKLETWPVPILSNRYHLGMN